MLLANVQSYVRGAEQRQLKVNGTHIRELNIERFRSLFNSVSQEDVAAHQKDDYACDVAGR